MATKASVDVLDWLARARPLVHQAAPEIQPFNTLVKLPIALSEAACHASVENNTTVTKQLDLDYFDIIVATTR